MPDINELGLDNEAVLIDYEAPEPGSFPPSLYPGTYQFLFKLEEDPFDSIEIEVTPGQPKRKFLQITHIAHTSIQSPSPVDPSLMLDMDVDLRFQRVNLYKHPKMSNSSCGDLIRALNLHFQGQPTPQLIAQELQAVSERTSYTAEVGWRAYCRDCQIEVSTHARKKKIKAGEQSQWPKGEDGKFIDMAPCPKCKHKMYGNAEIMRYKLPENGNGVG